MSFAKLILFAMLLQLAACGGGVSDDLLPSGEDRRPDVEPGTVGTQVGQISPDFSVQDTLDNTHVLSTELASADAVVLYFTMWCPICDSHTSHMRSMIIPDFPMVRFFLVDYVSGTISTSRAAQLANGYGTSTVLVDTHQALFNLYNASMGTVVVINSTGVVQLNEDYKDGVKLRDTLDALP